MADRLGIPFYSLNLQKDFRRIVDYFVDDYSHGRTPNPCVMCNNWIKFGRLFDFDDGLDARWIGLLDDRTHLGAEDVLGFGAQSADFDNDGWKDLLITNGYRKDVTNLDHISEIIRKTKFGDDETNKRILLDALNKLEDVKLESVKEEKEITPIENESDVIKFGHAIITEAILAGASDIHIEPFKKTSRVRFS